MRRLQHHPTVRLFQRRGAAAVAAVVLLVLLNLFIVAIVMTGARHQDLTVYHVETLRAFYAAESAATLALRELALEEDIDGDGVIGSIAPIAPPAFGGAQADVAIESIGEESTLTAAGRTERVHRSIQLLIWSTTGAGGPGGENDPEGSPVDCEYGGNDSEYLQGNHECQEFLLRNNAQINIVEPLVMVVHGDFRIENNARLNIVGDAELVVYVFGSFSMANNTELNLNTGDASRVRIVLLGEDQNVELSNRARLVADVVLDGDVNTNHPQAQHIGQTFDHDESPAPPYGGGGGAGGSGEGSSVLVHAWGEAPASSQ